MGNSSKAESIAKDIKLLILDVDGVLTDGGIYFDDNGTEHKKFDSQDGCGIKLLELSGVEVAIITARSTRSVAHRLETLGIKNYYHGIKDKGVALKELSEKLSIDLSESAFVDHPFLLLKMAQRWRISLSMVKLTTSTAFLTTIPI